MVVVPAPNLGRCSVAGGGRAAAPYQVVTVVIVA